MTPGLIDVVSPNAPSVRTYLRHQEAVPVGMDETISDLSVGKIIGQNAETYLSVWYGAVTVTDSPALRELDLPNVAQISRQEGLKACHR